MNDLESQGWARFQTRLEPKLRHTLRETVFAEGVAGMRCLLDHSIVREVSLRLKAELVQLGFLPVTAKAIQAIAFDKTAATNWKVTWHQDVVFPLGRAPLASGYELPTRKAEVDYARPPRGVLEALLAARLHLDTCDETNGPLRVSPGTHHSGILKSADMPYLAEKFGSVTCLAEEGEALLMKPLLLHASSPATAPKHRRVLHIVYHSGAPVTEPWHRNI